MFCFCLVNQGLFPLTYIIHYVVVAVLYNLKVQLPQYAYVGCQKVDRPFDTMAKAAMWVFKSNIVVALV